MGVWSSGDYALTEVQMTASADHVTGPWRYERIEGVGHDVPVAAPDQLNALLLDFLASAPAFVAFPASTPICNKRRGWGS